MKKMYRIKLFYLLVSLTLLSATKIDNPIISIEMGNVGFHRELNYVIHFDYPMAGKDCEYYLEQKFPAAVYVNVDQLNDLVRLKKLKAIYPTFVDVEEITEKSSPFSMLLWGTPKISDKINLPINFRYHRASETDYVRVKIDKPKMYIKCLPSEGVTIPDDFKNTTYCIENTEIIPELLSSASIKSFSENCDWKFLEYNFYNKDNLIAYIPVGNSKLYQPVFYVTIIASWIGCIWILFTVYNKTENLKQNYTKIS